MWGLLAAGLGMGTGGLMGAINARQARQAQEEQIQAALRRLYSAPQPISFQSGAINLGGGAQMANYANWYKNILHALMMQDIQERIRYGGLQQQLKQQQ